MPTITCPKCNATGEIQDDALDTWLTCEACGSQFSALGPTITCPRCMTTGVVPKELLDHWLTCRECGAKFPCLSKPPERPADPRAKGQLYVEGPKAEVLQFPIHHYELTAEGGSGRYGRVSGAVPESRLPDLLVAARAIDAGEQAEAVAAPADERGVRPVAHERLAAKLVTILEQLLAAVASARGNSHHCREDHEPIENLHDQAEGLMAVLGLGKLPPLSEAGLFLTDRFFVLAKVDGEGPAQPWPAYTPVKDWPHPRDVDWQKCDKAVQHALAGARAIRDAEAKSPQPSPPNEVDLSRAATLAPAAPKTKGKRIDEKMLAMIRDDSERMYWPAQQWADTLHCAKSTVLDTKSWREICKPARERERLSRGKRLRRKPH
jgi:hypothetical protein